MTLWTSKKLSVRASLRPVLACAASSGMALAVGLGAGASQADESSFSFVPGSLIVSSSIYTGTAATVAVGQTLPGGGVAIANGTYPNVFANNTVDGSFGVTSPIILRQYSLSHDNRSAFLVNTLNVTERTGVSTSFSSKSELALNLSTSGSALTFMGYNAPINTLDVSNSNTPSHVDPTNPVAASYQRAIIQLNGFRSALVTPVNTYSGNNGRAAILNDLYGPNLYYTVGNAGNGSGTQPTIIVNNTGVQIAKPKTPDTIVVGTPQGTQGASTGFQYGYSVTQNGYAADKSGKDDNFRGEKIFHNTLYVTKGSGSNGVDTVYQVGASGVLPTELTAASTLFAILPGFPTGLAKSIVTDPTSPKFATTNFHPFGIWFANATTLYVADEGDGVNTAANAASPNAGLEKWTLSAGTWHLDYTLQKGLDLGAQYSVAGLPSTLNPATDGLRNITGKVNRDGTVTIVAVTSTISASGDQGADPNRLVAITDRLAATSLPADEQFHVLDTANFAQVLRGVAFAPSEDQDDSRGYRDN
ncbi:hypothetical protein RZS28_02480 [Methylocapsa polymorpha]|uniref:Uncharacterized protein n=1 Tax=Methylocapsa polymorpha TaxID=3080828 RepID=A0ABZ0HTE9_9HYPH|nr:hypothetical protein RZS28_02480 [Methylocapsa sp. RX1]